MKALLLFALIASTTFAKEPALVPGNAVFGTRNFIEYVPGDLPLIIAAPHGGYETPEDMPNRNDGVTVSDAHTQELARTIAAVIHARTGHHIHLIICRLNRSKLDANREVIEAAQGNPIAITAWQEHHAFIDQACAAAMKQYGAAFFIDLHGQGHPDPRVEIGYLHDPLNLADCEDRIELPSFRASGSIALFAEGSEQRYTDLLRGPMSLGALLEERGFRATPSPRMPVPTTPYFPGGYTVTRHCVADNGVAGLQIEANRARLRDTAENRLRFANALIDSLEVYLPQMLGIELSAEAARKKDMVQSSKVMKPLDTKK